MKLKTTLMVMLMAFPLSQVMVIYFFNSIVLPGAEAGTYLHDMLSICLHIMMAIFLVSFIASIIGGSMILKPVSKLMNGIKKIQHGDYKARIHYYGKNEIGELAAAFNSLMDTIEQNSHIMSKSLDELSERDAHYQFALSVSSELVFKLNIATDELSTDQKRWQEFFGREAPKTITEAYAMAVELVYPEDWAEFKRAFAPEFFRGEILRGQFSETLEARILNKEGKYIWAQHTIKTTGPKNDIRVIGRIVDIDAMKKKELEIVRESQKDGLTGLLRKKVAEGLIDDYLSGDGLKGEHGLFIVDIDDFKLINDKAGHLYGDAVLTEVSKRIASLFRNTDIIGRIGGDEFLILLKNIKYNNLILEKAEALVDIFDTISATMQSNTKITGSVGVVKYPTDGMNYRDLFSKADKALYRTKGNGKNSYSFYNEAFEREQFITGIKKDDYYLARKHEGPDLIDNATRTKDTITRDIFQILYESKDIKKTINLIMEIIGRFYDVSRVYIFEVLPGRNQYSYSFEWCNEGIKPDIDTFSVTNLESLANYKDNFNEEGIFYSEDTAILPDTIYKGQESNRVHSLLECAILNKGEFAGFIGFEECNDKRFWVKDEIDTLVLVARILAVVLVHDKNN